VHAGSRTRRLIILALFIAMVGGFFLVRYMRTHVSKEKATLIAKTKMSQQGWPDPAEISLESIEWKDKRWSVVLSKENTILKQDVATARISRDGKVMDVIGRDQIASRAQAVADRQGFINYSLSALWYSHGRWYASLCWMGKYSDPDERASTDLLSTPLDLEFTPEGTLIESDSSIRRPADPPSDVPAV